jgi:uncharacterized protein YjiS (DUF1127 family)
MSNATYAAETATTRSPSLVHLAGHGRMVWQRYQAWIRRRATVRVLERLSDRTLRDIGLTRGQIPSVARDPGAHNRERGI